MLAEVGKGYVTKKRKEHLVSIIEDNQPKVDLLIEKIRQAVSITADQVRSQYSLNKREMRRMLVSDEEDAEWVVEQVYAYSSKVAATLDLLREADRSYMILGGKHAELLNFLDGQPFSTAELQESVGRLEKMYRKLEAIKEKQDE